MPVAATPDRPCENGAGRGRRHGLQSTWRCRLRGCGPPAFPRCTSCACGPQVRNEAGGFLENDRCRAVPKQGQGLPVFRTNAFAGDFSSDHQHPFDVRQLKLVCGQGKRGHETQTRGVDVEGVAVRLASAFHGRQRECSLARMIWSNPLPPVMKTSMSSKVREAASRACWAALRSHDGQRLMRDLVSHVHTTVLHAQPLGKPCFSSMDSEDTGAGRYCPVLTMRHGREMDSVDFAIKTRLWHENTKEYFKKGAFSPNSAAFLVIMRRSLLP